MSLQATGRECGLAQPPIGENCLLDGAGALGAVGITVLAGLDGKLRIKRGERLMIIGASGGIGHIAVQLAKRLGAKVFAIASGKDGVAFMVSTPV